MTVVADGEVLSSAQGVAGEFPTAKADAELFEGFDLLTTDSPSAASSGSSAFDDWDLETAVIAMDAGGHDSEDWDDHLAVSSHATTGSFVHDDSDYDELDAESLLRAAREGMPEGWFE